MAKFNLRAPYAPAGDQGPAIDRLVAGLEAGRRHQVLLGVTGSGKTFTMANVIARTGRTTLVISHNKTLAAQLYSEFKEFFPENAVHYFVSYYDYYQPEAYIPQKDIYIEKDAMINQEIDRLRLAATSALMSRDDVVIVASVSCIYGLGSPDDYAGMVLTVRAGEALDRRLALRRLVDIQYARNETALKRGTFRVRGDTVEVWPAYEEQVVRVAFDGDLAESIQIVDPLTGETKRDLQQCCIYPAKHFVMPDEKVKRALGAIRTELAERLGELKSQNKLLEAQRLEARTRYDLEMLEEVGYCHGIENYSRPLSGRLPGQRPYTLIDYFPKGFLTIVDESHVTLPQIHGMFNGDQSRKRVLVDYGFRLPSALDNRPMRFEEWEAAVGARVYVSATPAGEEMRASGGSVVEQVIRPTGLVDPPIVVRPSAGQVQDLLDEVRTRVGRHERVLVTTLTKRLAEQLSQYLVEAGIKCCYLHSEVQTIERVEILRNLREGKFDVIVGVNLLREGLDLPEVSLVAILDADKEGFLRSETSLIQTVGRTARNVNGEVLLYADTVTDSMKRAMEETDRRRRRQTEYNAEHGITPKTVAKAIRAGIEEEIRTQKMARLAIGMDEKDYESAEIATHLEREMFEAAERLEFEKAAELRDLVRELREKSLETGPARGKRGRSAARS
ncbi:MAG: excinuclease ABC subunit UvrB [Planctomycetes bacterium]|nr:excinuclease ABC subunit UvrB [Planctomycetota bacterium]